MQRIKNSQPFAPRVYKVVRAMPPGETLTYSEVALRAGNPRAARAVARLMSKNFDPNIPCHRVVRKDGTLGGYNRGGVDAKRVLLHNEKVTRTPCLP